MILLGDAAHTAHFSIGSRYQARTRRRDQAGGSSHASFEEPRRRGNPRLCARSLAIRLLPRGRARRISRRTEPRSPQAPEQRAQLDRMVRDARTLWRSSNRCRSLFPAHPQPARRPRESAAARPGMARKTSSADYGSAPPTAIEQDSPPMFAPLQACARWRSRNRVTVSPMAMYSAVDGVAQRLPLRPLRRRAPSAARGCLFTEMTCVSPEGRIRPGCTGMWNAEHVAAWKRIVDFVHAQSKAKIRLQLGHSGRKGSTRLGWEGNDDPLDEGNWPVIAASDVPWSPANQKPRAMTRADMDRSATNSSRPCTWASKAASTWSSCTPRMAICCPASSRRCRTIEPTVWRPLENRLRYPLEVFAAMRAAWPRQADVGPHLRDRLGRRGRHHADDAVLIGEASRARART